MANELKEITGFPEYYINEEGKIFTSKVARRNNPKGELRELQISHNKSGYKYANLYCGSGKENRKSIRIHRLVYQEFKGCIPAGFHIDHIDNNKGNNHMDNLQLLTPSENNKKARAITPVWNKGMNKQQQDEWRKNKAKTK